jgi:hypothetical protein
MVDVSIFWPEDCNFIGLTRNNYDKCVVLTPYSNGSKDERKSHKLYGNFHLRLSI